MSLTNLNKARKQRAKKQAKATADQNAVRFGRSKAHKCRDEVETRLASKTLDGAKRTDT